MIKEKLSKYISDHPFIFVISLLLVVSCCVGVFLSVAQAGQTANKATDTATVTVTATTSVQATVTIQGTATVSELMPTDTWTDSPNEDVSPTATNTLLPENTETTQLATASPTITTTVTPSMRPLLIHFINVGQGDSILILSPDGQTMLIDGGSANTGIVAYLRGQGVKRIDLMVATHPHEDHIGGLVQVLEAIPVNKVITNGVPTTTAVYEHFLDAILSSKAEYSEVKRDDSITLGALRFSVLNPGGNLGDDLNESSIVLRLVYGKTTILFMGDAGKVAEASMMAAGELLKTDILKIGHHGSCLATGLSFLQAAQPAVGIYSAGINNQYGFPCAATINALHHNGVLVLGTDVNGSIIATITEDGYRITDAAGNDLR